MNIEIFENRGYVEPLVHINESYNEIVVMIDLPYVKKDDIDLRVGEKEIEIRTIIKRTFKDKHSVNFRFFHKIIALPSKVIQEKARARFEKNILIITLPKEKNIKRIKIE